MTKLLHRGLGGALSLLLLFSASSALAAFNQLTNTLLSVDINGGGGNPGGTQLGWDGATVLPVSGPIGGTVPPAAGTPVQWQPWGALASVGGDGTALPNFPGTGVASISKTFGAITAEISIPGNAAGYSQVGTPPTKTMDSRDRGDLANRDGSGGDANARGRNMYRDFVFTGNSQQTRSKNHIQLKLSGLQPNKPYTIAIYAFDVNQGVAEGFSATAPSADGYLNGTGGFLPPADLKISSWVTGTTGVNVTAPPDPVLFTKLSDAQGTFSVWMFGMGNNLTAAQAGDPNNVDSNNRNTFNDMSSTYLNGFQIALVPEPAAFGLASLALGALGVVRRRRA